MRVWLAVNDGEAAPGHPPFFLARLKLSGASDTGPDDWETFAEAYDWQIAVDLAFDNYPHMAYVAPTARCTPLVGRRGAAQRLPAGAGRQRSKPRADRRPAVSSPSPRPTSYS
jgi:hypothetical protein